MANKVHAKHTQHVWPIRYTQNTHNMYGQEGTRTNISVLRLMYSIALAQP